MSLAFTTENTAQLNTTADDYAEIVEHIGLSDAIPGIQVVAKEKVKRYENLVCTGHVDTVSVP